jgi:phenylacetate-CoA ligase
MNGESRLRRLNALFEAVLPGNAFQRERLGKSLRLDSLDELRALPRTSKAELVADQASNPPFGTNLTFELSRYTHLHQTSGTTGTTLRILDTAEDWRWWRSSLGEVMRAAGVTAGDRVALAYSFGPYVQFWASYEGVQDAGAIVIALGGMSSVQRLHTIRDYEASALLCTPSYALHLAKVAVEHDLGDAFEPVRRVICTGEPGASVASVRKRIESALGALCFDHAGATEAGSFARPCATDGGLHLAEEEFICEVLDPESGVPMADGELGELVVTALGRTGFPVVRYRTGDVVRCSAEPCSGGHNGRWLPDGVIGRADDMVIIRGMNVFPSAIEQTMRESPGVGEFRITFYSDPRAMDEVKIELELDDPSEGRQIQDRMRHQLGLRVRIVPLKRGILPAQEGKARRVEDLRVLTPARDEQI